MSWTLNVSRPRDQYACRHGSNLNENVTLCIPNATDSKRRKFIAYRQSVYPKRPSPFHVDPDPPPPQRQQDSSVHPFHFILANSASALHGRRCSTCGSLRPRRLPGLSRGATHAALHGWTFLWDPVNEGAPSYMMARVLNKRAAVPGGSSAAMQLEAHLVRAVRPCSCPFRRRACACGTGRGGATGEALEEALVSAGVWWARHCGAEFI